MPALNTAYLRRAWPYLQKLQSVIGLIAIIVVAIAVSPVDSRDGSIIFLSGGNLTDVLRQMSEIGIIALGMTLVIITAGIDLSVGSVLALSATLVAQLLVGWVPGLGLGVHIAVAVGVALLATAAVGVVNGLVVAQLKLQPFIVTLAAMIGVRGLARWSTNNANIDIGFGDGVSTVFVDLVSAKYVVIGTFVVLTVVFWLVLSKTVFGRYVRAIGDNAKASVYAGLPTKRVLVAVYALAGLMAGIAGVLHAAQNRQGSPNDGVMYELEAIAAVVIGGTSLMGGKGTIWGTVVGASIMGILTNIFRLRGVDINVEMMVKAVIIVAAVWVQQKEAGGAWFRRHTAQDRPVEDEPVDEERERVGA